MVKNVPAMPETSLRSLRPEDTLEKGMATHSSTLVWRISWREESGRLQSMELQRVRHDLVTKQQQHGHFKWRWGKREFWLPDLMFHLSARMSLIMNNLFPLRRADSLYKCWEKELKNPIITFLIQILELHIFDKNITWLNSSSVWRGRLPLTDWRGVQL